MRAVINSCLACLFAVGVVRGQERPGRDVLVTFEGNRAVPSERLLEVADECFARHPQEQKAGPDVLERCLAEVTSFLWNQGYLRAALGKPRSREAAGGVRITVPVEEGARYRLGEVTIEGARLFPPGYLLAMLDLKAGDVADARAVYEWLNSRVSRLYAEKGHIQFAADPEPHFRPVAAETGEGVVDFKVGIVEGRRFVVRRIEFVGDKGVPEPTLRGAVPLRAGEPFDQSLYEEGVRNLNRLGLLEEVDGVKDVTWRSADRSGLLDLIFHIREKARP